MVHNNVYHNTCNCQHRWCKTVNPLKSSHRPSFICIGTYGFSTSANNLFVWPHWWKRQVVPFLMTTLALRNHFPSTAGLFFIMFGIELALLDDPLSVIATRPRKWMKRLVYWIILNMLLKLFLVGSCALLRWKRKKKMVECFEFFCI